MRVVPNNLGPTAKDLLVRAARISLMDLEASTGGALVRTLMGRLRSYDFSATTRTTSPQATE